MAKRHQQRPAEERVGRNNPKKSTVYIDLRHLEQGEFVATANMVAGPENLYVPKKDIDYVLWNRLNQVTNPARLDDEV